MNLSLQHPVSLSVFVSVSEGYFLSDHSLCLSLVSRVLRVQVIYFFLHMLILCICYIFFPGIRHSISSSLYSPSSDRVGLPLHNTPFPGVLMKVLEQRFSTGCPSTTCVGCNINIIFWPEVN